MLQPSIPETSSHPFRVQTEAPDAEVLGQLVELATAHPDEAILVVHAAEQDAGRRVVLANSAYLAMSGYSENEVVGRPARGFLAPHLEERESTRFLDSLGSDESSHGIAVSYRGDGSEYLLDWRTLPLTNRSGDITHYVSMQRVIADQSRAVA